MGTIQRQRFKKVRKPSSRISNMLRVSLITVALLALSSKASPVKRPSGLDFLDALGGDLGLQAEPHLHGLSENEADVGSESQRTPKCYSYCAKRKTPWTRKCAYKSKSCSACCQCTDSRAPPPTPPPVSTAS